MNTAGSNVVGGVRQSVARTSKIKLTGAVLSFVLATATVAARAEPGVTADRILIGQAASTTSPVVGGSVKEQIAGANVYFSMVNAKGGIYGRKIELKVVDDDFNPKKTPVVVKQLIDVDKVFALFMIRGAAHVEACLPILAKDRVPLVAPSTGAITLHRPVQRYVFNVRAKFQDEVSRAINQMATTGITSMGMFYADDSFGQDALDGFKTAMNARGLQPSLVQPFKRPMTDISANVQAFLKAAPQAVFVIGTGGEAVKFIKEMKKGGSTSQFITLSTNAAQSFINALGPDGRGVIITQVVPATSSGGMSIVHEYELMAKEQGVRTTDAGMEGFMGAKVLVEGLRRAGRDLTRERLVNALETFNGYDLGGIVISYGPTDHTGSDFVEMSIISEGGKVIR